MSLMPTFAVRDPQRTDRAALVWRTAGLADLGAAPGAPFSGWKHRRGCADRVTVPFRPAAWPSSAMLRWAMP